MRTQRMIAQCCTRAACGQLRMSSSTPTHDDLDAIFKQKRLLRTQVRKTLKSIDPYLRSKQDNAVQDIVLRSPWFKSTRRLCAYISCAALREVDTFKILSEILQQNNATGGKKLYVPRVEDKNSHMRMLHISRIDDLVANSMDILEPAPVDSEGNAREDVMQANGPVDLFLLPGLAFDKSGRRLGRGGGYYDTFLKNYQDLAKTQNWKQPLLVALSYSEQILDEGIIPITSSDLPIDALVSPEGVIPISPAALNRAAIIGLARFLKCHVSCTKPRIYFAFERAWGVKYHFRASVENFGHLIGVMSICELVEIEH